jgi:type IX secretion system PorP/SprF family membrane protein
LKINIFKIFLVLLIALPLLTVAQTAPMFTQYKNSQMFSNPAFAGMSEGISINGLMRQQWAGFSDDDGNKVAPQTFLISGDSPVKILHGGVGGSIIQDKSGFFSNVGLQLSYSFHLDLALGKLGIGAGINLINSSLDASKFITAGGGNDDPALNKGNESSMIFDANLGLFFRSPDRFYFGVSAANILETSAKKLTTESYSGIKNDRTFYLVAGYQYVLPNHPIFEIEPSIQIISDIAATQYNLSAVVKYNNRFWGGLNYRFQESVGVIVGMSIKDFRIGYSYDVSTMAIGLPGSHEIHLGYIFKLDTDKSGTRYKNTRYL